MLATDLRRSSEKARNNSYNRWYSSFKEARTKVEQLLEEQAAWGISAFTLTVGSDTFIPLEHVNFYMRWLTEAGFTAAYVTRRL